eukprot:scaffold12968_cov73-Isochrysis_galbana.AAC.1
MRSLHHGQNTGGGREYYGDAYARTVVVAPVTLPLLGGRRAPALCDSHTGGMCVSWKGGLCAVTRAAVPPPPLHPYLDGWQVNSSLVRFTHGPRRVF